MADPVALLHERFEVQRRAAAANPYPSMATRRARLDDMATMLRERREHFRAALAEDFGNHHPWMSDMLETGSVLGRVLHVADNFEQWLQPTEVQLEGAHGSSRAQILRLPKGVNGIIAPWNFPIDCSLVMVADQFAGGNRAIIKPSELAPATSTALAEAVAHFFDPADLAVVEGGTDLAVEFARLPWDHLTFTGSARVGRLVAQAAAANLVPLTLELGGKNPALFTSDAVNGPMVARFLAFRAMKAGQVCTSPDYALVPRAELSRWVELAVAEWSAAYPRWVGHPDATGLINDHHYRRVEGYVDEARLHGVQVVRLNGDEPSPATRQYPMTVVVDPPESLACLHDEVFGPVIPVVPYDGVEEAMAWINARPTPLAGYVATVDEALAARFTTLVRCGGAGINTFGLQGGHPALPFGGSGASGYGVHSGRDGVLGYTHTKSVFIGSDDSIVHQAIALPLAPLCGYVVDAMFDGED